MTTRHTKRNVLDFFPISELQEPCLFCVRIWEEENVKPIDQTCVIVAFCDVVCGA